MSDLTRSIPIAIHHMLKEEQNHSDSSIFQDALPALLLSYGSVCSNQGVSAEISDKDRRTFTFWNVMTHHYCRTPITFEEYAFVFWLGFHPSNLAMKRDLINEAAQLLTQQVLHHQTDHERNEWLNEHGRHIFPGYNEYRNVMSLYWVPN